jgi:hypothetical protein
MKRRGDTKKERPLFQDEHACGKMILTVRRRGGRGSNTNSHKCEYRSLPLALALQLTRTEVFHVHFPLPTIITCHGPVRCTTPRT